MRLATVVGVIALAATGCGSHHDSARGAHGRRDLHGTIRVVLKSTTPACNHPPIGGTTRQFTRWLRRCQHG